MGAHQLSLQGWINEGLMTIFFFVVGPSQRRGATFSGAHSVPAGAIAT